MLPLVRFLDMLFPPRSDERVVRTTTNDSLAALVSPQTVLTCQPHATTLLPFANPNVRALVHEAKYHGNTRAFSLLGHVLDDYLTDVVEEECFGKTVLVSVPLSRARRKTRGYNQSEEIAQHVARTTITLASDLLVRVRDTSSQTTLSRSARKENMRGAFSSTHILDPSVTYLLFDDVLTTSATMQAAIDALTDAGAIHILPLALAH